MTNRTMSLVMVGGLAGLLGLGAAALTRAQAPGPKANRPDLRDRLIVLRTEVELLQLEHDVDKDDMCKAMVLSRSLQREGLDKDALEHVRGIVKELRSYREQATEEQLAEFVKQAEAKLKDQKHNSIDQYLLDKKFKNVDDQELFNLIAAEEVKARVQELDAKIDKAKARFSEQTEHLNSRKLDLEDAECSVRGER